MKKIIYLAIFALFLIIPNLAKAEKIDNFDVTIRINSDASINVTEKINYNFENLQRHGIFRTIPIKYKARGGNYNLRISDISVIDEQGYPYNYVISYPGKNIEIKIGDPDVLITGQKVYIINYTINRAINYFSDHDELYWNITGNEWPVAILNSSAQIILPGNFSADKLQKTCYSGPYGSQTLCTDSKYILEADKFVSNVYFKQAQLNPEEGLTIVLGWPKGIVYQPTFWQVIWETIKDNWVLFLPIIIFVFLLTHWYTHGRDAQGRQVIIPQFDVPDNLIPAEVGTLIDEKAENKDISAELIYLATQGFLKITKENGDYTLDLLKPETDLANEFDKQLITAIFSAKTQIKLSDLEDKFYKDLAKLKSKLYNNLTTEGYFKNNPNAVRGAYLGIGIVIIFVSFIMVDLWGGLATLSFILCGILMAIFSFYMPAKTVKGVLAKEHILGLKLYLTVAEKERIKFHNAPAKNPKTFETYLPYAMVLGVENEWAKQFANIYNKKPDWYNDPSSSNFTALMLVNNLNSFQSEARSTFASAPASACRGCSGVGGGGWFLGPRGGGASNLKKKTGVFLFFFFFFCFFFVFASNH
jgi:uncharacterized membrane protein